MQTYHTPVDARTCIVNSYRAIFIIIIIIIIIRFHRAQWCKYDFFSSYFFFFGPRGFIETFGNKYVFYTSYS